jgi:hypothetical protein
MNQRCLFALIGFSLVLVVDTLGPRLAYGGDVDFIGEVAFPDGEVAQYKVEGDGVLVISDRTGTVYFLKHSWNEQSRAASVQSFVERPGVAGFLRMPRQTILRSASPLDISKQDQPFVFHFFDLRITELQYRERSTAMDPGLDTLSSVCCVPCNGRLLCAAEVSISCGSCEAENLL